MNRLGEFLRVRRASVPPAEHGMPAGQRRVPGLRREEVAMLAGVSTDYYVRLEKGNVAGVSEQVLNAVAGALQLDEAERVHLSNLVRAGRAGRDGRTPRRRGRKVRPGLQW